MIPPTQEPPAEAHVREGNARFHRGELTLAADSYTAALAVDPRHSKANYNLGFVMQQLGRREEAIACYARAVDAAPDFAKPLVNWGNLLRESGDIDGATALYRRALLADGRDAHALNNLASIASARGELAEARALYERSIECGNEEARLALGNLLHASGEHDAALAIYAPILSTRPQHAEAHYNSGLALHALKRLDEAAVHYAQAIAADPDLPDALSSWGNALWESGDIEGALPLYRRALLQNPRDWRALNNLASDALDRGDISEARQLFKRAAETSPETIEPRYNLGLIALREQEFQGGWETYELRFQTDPPDASVRPLPFPRLMRGDLSRSPRVALLKEQGTGDQILLSTLLPELAARGVRPVVELDRRLVALYRRSMPGVEFVSDAAPDRAFDGCDHQLPMGSLPGLLRNSKESFAAQPRALLTADPVRTRELASRLPSGVKIGMSWRSFQRGRRKLFVNRKSIPLEHFAALEGIGHLIDLQYGNVDQERREFDSRHPGLRAEIAGLDRLNDMDGLLSVIASCDLIVTSSNVTAHLAGAIGKRTWLVYLGANAPFYYWVPGPDGRSLWYPSVEIMSAPGWTTWDQVFLEVARRLKRETW